MDGIVSDGNGAYGPIVAPFSGRACIAFVIEISRRLATASTSLRAETK